MQICVNLLCCTSRGRCTVAAQSKFSFMLVLCSRQIPAKANKLILSYLILCTDSTIGTVTVAAWYTASWPHSTYESFVFCGCVNVSVLQGICDLLPQLSRFEVPLLFNRAHTLPQGYQSLGVNDFAFTLRTPKQMGVGITVAQMYQCIRLLIFDYLQELSDSSNSCQWIRCTSLYAGCRPFCFHSCGCLNVT